MNPSKILDSIGRILTPVFAIMIVNGYCGRKHLNTVLTVLRMQSQAYQASAFGKGFLEGYNTLDALASVAFSVVAVVTLNQLGFKSKKRVYLNDLGRWFRSDSSSLVLCIWD